MNTCCRVGKCTLSLLMQILDRLSVIGFFWLRQYRTLVHAKNPYRYTSTIQSTQSFVLKFVKQWLNLPHNCTQGTVSS